MFVNTTDRLHKSCSAQCACVLRCRNRLVPNAYSSMVTIAVFWSRNTAEIVNKYRASSAGRGKRRLLVNPRNVDHVASVSVTGFSSLPTPSARTGPPSVVPRAIRQLRTACYAHQNTSAICKRALYVYSDRRACYHSLFARSA